MSTASRARNPKRPNPHTSRCQICHGRGEMVLVHGNNEVGFSRERALCNCVRRRIYPVRPMPVI
jgi:hypothetical protein